MAALLLSRLPSAMTLFSVVFLSFLGASIAQSQKITDLIVPYGQDGIYTLFPKNNTLALRLTATITSMWKSKHRYFHGIFSIKIAIPRGFSAGTVTSFYLASQNPFGGNDEVDFELLGHVDPRRMVIHTNYWTKGKGGHEEQMAAWFDASQLHTYTIVWGYKTIVWMVDNIPIRQYKQAEGPPGVNMSNTTVTLPMVLEGSLWDGSQWATRDYNHSMIVADYKYAPFTSVYSDFSFEGCIEKTPKPKCMTKKYPTGYPWDGELSPGRTRILERMRRKYLNYRVGWRREGRHPPGMGGHPPGVGKHPPKKPPPNHPPPRAPPPPK